MERWFTKEQSILDIHAKINAWMNQVKVLKRNMIRNIVFDDVEVIIRLLKKSSNCATSQEYRDIVQQLDRLCALKLDFTKNQAESMHNSIQQFKELAQLDTEIAENVSDQQIERVLNERSGNFLLILDGIANMSNRAAILRTAEALGIQHVWIILPPSIKMQSKGVQNKISKKSQKWISTKAFSSSQSCISSLLEEGWELWTSELHHQEAAVLSLDITQKINCPQKLAIAVGSEARGVSKELSEFSSRKVFLPMSGFTESLNVSVATALIIQRIFDIYPTLRRSLDEDEKKYLRLKWKAAQLANSRS